MSPAVRRIVENPQPDARVSLRVTLTDTAATDRPRRFERAIAGLDGCVETSLPYNALRVTIPEEAVEELCSLTGIAAVETIAVLDPGDAGEDIDLTGHSG